MTPTPRRRHSRVASARYEHWGALALMVRPTYIAVELVVASAATGGYSVAADSVSQLGEIGCSATQCSSRHEVMNGAFMVFGALLVVGALLLARPLGVWVTGLLAISGLSSIATGLAPLDQDATLHAVAAVPLFVAQPIALVALGARLSSDRSALGKALAITGCVTGVSAVAFVLGGDGPMVGVFERLALWPVLLGLAVFAWTRLARTRHHHAADPST